MKVDTQDLINSLNVYKHNADTKKFNKLIKYYKDYGYNTNFKELLEYFNLYEDYHNHIHKLYDTQHSNRVRAYLMIASYIIDNIQYDKFYYKDFKTNYLIKSPKDREVISFMYDMLIPSIDLQRCYNKKGNIPSAKTVSKRYDVCEHVVISKMNYINMRGVML